MIRNWCDEKGARALARMITAYWDSLGFKVKTDIIPRGSDQNNHRIWAVISDLDHRGLPAAATAADFPRIRRAMWAVT